MNDRLQVVILSNRIWVVIMPEILMFAVGQSCPATARSGYIAAGAVR